MVTDTVQVSVLISIYLRDDVQQLQCALNSITFRQTVAPDQVVVVCDGPISDEADVVLDAFERRCRSERLDIEIVRLSENRGLAAALNSGLEHCGHPWIIRMDADDISFTNRIELTKRELSELEQSHSEDRLAIYGFAYKLFDKHPESSYGVRKCPENVMPGDRSAYLSTPVNHPTIALRRDCVVDLGGYPANVGRFEDWALCLTLLNEGYQIKNSSQPVLHFRAPKVMMVRRGGWNYALEEIRALFIMVGAGVLPWYWGLINVCIRTPVRLLPIRIRYFIYQKYIWN